MTFSFTSLLTNFFFSSLLILFISLSLRNSRYIRLIGISTIFYCIALIMLRLFAPFEFSFSTNILSRHVLPVIVLFIKKPIITFDNYPINLLFILYVVWGIGAIINLCRVIHSYIYFRKAINAFPVLEHPTVQNILHNILEKYSSLVSLRIIQTDRISTPMIFGFRNPCIAVPKISLTEKEWYYILSHEVEHFFHGHLWNKAICEFLQIIYWWNPFVYLLKKQMYKALEMQVDISVTKSMNEAERIEYLECLLKIAKNCVRQVDKIALTFASEQSSILSQRFYLILNNYHEKENSKIRNIFFIIPILFIIIFSCFVVFEPYYISSEDEANTFELTSNTSYLVLNPDGGYDIYLNDEYVTTIHEIMDSIKDLTIYQNIKEAHKNEKIQ